MNQYDFFPKTMKRFRSLVKYEMWKAKEGLRVVLDADAKVSEEGITEVK